MTDSWGIQAGQSKQLEEAFAAGFLANKGGDGKWRFWEHGPRLQIVTEAFQAWLSGRRQREEP